MKRTRTRLSDAPMENTCDSHSVLSSSDKWPGKFRTRFCAIIGSPISRRTRWRCSWSTMPKSAWITCRISWGSMFLCLKTSTDDILIQVNFSNIIMSFFGFRPTLLDAYLYGYLSILNKAPFVSSPLKSQLSICSNLCSLIGRTRKDYFAAESESKLFCFFDKVGT